MQRTYTHEEWMEEATRLFGEDSAKWRFVCPSCGYIATVSDWKAVGATAGEVAFSCIGRHMEGAADIMSDGGGPCNYAGGGLFRLNTVTVVCGDGSEHAVFDFDRSHMDKAQGK